MWGAKPGLATAAGAALCKLPSLHTYFLKWRLVPASWVTALLPLSATLLVRWAGPSAHETSGTWTVCTVVAAILALL